MAGPAASGEGAFVEGVIAAADWLVVAPVAIGITVGALLTMFRHRARSQAMLAISALMAITLANALLLARVLDEGPVAMTMGRWLPPFGISFVADPLGASFALVSSFVALVCAVFAARNIDATGRRYGFFPFLLVLMAGVNGAFLTGDIFNLYVWFEVFLVSSFGLLILGSEREQIDGTTKYAILNLIATALFLVATAYLYGAAGTLNMADLARKAPQLAASAPLTTIAALYMMAFAMKAAAFPVNFWLPASYHTPKIVTAALFGGLLTKIGIYALLRTLGMLFPAERLELSGAIGWVAVATIILGAMGALAQTDIRRMIGFLVISGVGLMLAGLAVGNAAGFSGAALYATHSMLAMAALYLLAGLMKERGGSFSLDRLSGLYRSSPLLAGLALVLFLAVAGLPPGSGLWPKIMLVKASIDAGNGWLAGAILTGGILTTLALGRVFALAFWRNGEASEAPPPAISGAVSYASVIALTVPIVLLGVYPEPAIAIAMKAASGLLDPAPYIGSVFPEVSR